jgi:hypothetical protein
MGRVNVYAQITSDSGRSVSIGGRGANDSLRVKINTDNALQTDCALSVEASVLGPGLRSAERRRKDSDKRRTEFAIRLPEDPKGWSLAFYTQSKLVELSGEDLLGMLDTLHAEAKRKATELAGIQAAMRG